MTRRSFLSSLRNLACTVALAPVMCRAAQEMVVIPPKLEPWKFNPVDYMGEFRFVPLMTEQGKHEWLDHYMRCVRGDDLMPPRY